MIRHFVSVSFLAVALTAAILLPVGNAPAAPVSAPHQAGEIIIKFKGDAAQHDKDEVLTDLGGTRIKGLGRIKAELRRLRSGLTVEEAIGRYRNHPKVEYIEPNYMLQASIYPDDPQLEYLWALENDGRNGGTPGADIKAIPAWDITTGSDQVLIGLIDTGVDYNHSDLAANIWTNPGEIPGNGLDDDNNGYVDDVRGWDFYHDDNDPMDDNGHGTHTAGTIGAVGNNGNGVTGVNWRVKILPLKFLGETGWGTTADAIDAIEYATRMGVTLTSNSWGGGAYSQALLEAIQDAGEAGILFVAAAGNNGQDADIDPGYPAGYPLDNIISVAATDRDDVLADFSTYGAQSVDLAAPGVDVLSTLPGERYGYSSGTSMACPHVAGVLGLVYAQFPDIGHLDAKDLILDSVDPIPSLAGRVLTGGRLNAFSALAEPDSTAPGPVTGLAVTEPGSNWLVLSWTATGDDGGTGTASRYAVKISATPIDESNFAAAQAVPGPPRPGPVGSLETMKVTGLSPSITYYLAVKAYDEFGNSSPLPGSVAGTTLGPPMAAVSPAGLSEILVTGTTGNRSLTLSNTAEGTLDFHVPRALYAATPPPVADYLEVAKGGEDPRIGDPVVAGTGGPDGFGYRWMDSDEPGGPAFEWADISQSGTLVTYNGDDENWGPFPIGFTFPFYGAEFSEVRICNNGFLSFTDPSGPYAYQPLPNPLAPRNMIAPMWTDLFVSSVVYQNDGDRFIVQWKGLSLDGEYVEIQAILYPDGTIDFQYNRVDGSSASVGIQNANGDDGLLVAFNTPYLRGELAVRIRATPEWLAVTPTDGTLYAGESTDLNVSFDPAGLLVGTYDAEIEIQSNDPENPALSVPVSLTVLGAPDIAVTPLTYDFGPVYVGGTASTGIQVKNPGSDSLHVTGVTTDNAVFAADPISFVVPPHGAATVPATFTPEAAGPAGAVLGIASDDPDSPIVEVALSGTGLIPPEIAVSPDSLGEALLNGTSSSRTLSVRNDGASDLLVDVTVLDAFPVVPPPYSPGPAGDPEEDSQSASSDVPVPAQSPESPLDPSVLVIQDTEAWGVSMSAFLLDDFGLPSTVIPSSDLAAVDLSPFDLIITVGDEGADYCNALSGAGGKLTDFVERGGILQCQLSTAGSNVEVPGGVLVRFGEREYYNVVLIPDHPIVQGLGSLLPGGISHAVLTNLPAGAQVITENRDSHLPTTAEYGIGLGRVIVTGMDWEYLYAWNRPTGVLLPNATAYSLSLVGPKWVRPESARTTVAPGREGEVNLIFDATGLAGGGYDAAVVVLSNDPDDPQVVVPVRLQVTNAPDLILSAYTLDFGEVFTGTSEERTLCAVNAGTDVLGVGNVLSGFPDYTVDPVSFDLDPGDSLDMVVRFRPAAEGDRSSQLTLESNDPNGAQVVTLTGTGLIPPVATVDPAEFSSDLYTNDVDQHVLTVGNFGGSDLRYTVDYLGSSGSAGPPPPPPPGAKIALHVQTHAAKQTQICQPAADGGAAPTDIPCSGYVNQGAVGTTYDVYVAVGNVTDGAGISGVTFGIDYDPEFHRGVDVLDWIFCSSGLEFPSDTWPAPGSGNSITWLLPDDCQDTEIAPNGAHAVAGAFYVYAYSEDLLRITPHYQIPDEPKLAYADCSGAGRDIPETAAGSARFTADGLTPGFNPCRDLVVVDEDTTSTAEGPGYPVVEGHGGPDNFGYVWVDSDDPAGPAFDWIDIRGVGHVVPVAGDRGFSGMLPIGFLFPFYGNFFDHFRVFTDGYISFTSDDVTEYNRPLPSTSGVPNMLAPFWENLNLPDARIYYLFDGNRLIVQFQEVPRYEGDGTYTFEVILDPSGTIIYQYLSMVGRINSATVGIQNATRTDGLTVAYNNGYVRNQLAVRLRAKPVWLSVNPLLGTLPPQGSDAIQVVLDADHLSGSTYLADILVESNDPLHPRITIPVTLNVTSAPELTASPTTLDFGGVYVGYPKTLSFEIKNTAIGHLDVSSMTPGLPDFTVDPLKVVVGPSETQTVEVTFVPQSPGTRNTDLTLASSDPRGPHTLTLFGTGVIPPVIEASPDTVVGAALPGGTKVKPLTLCNSGGSDLIFAAAAYQEPPPPPPQAGPKVALHVRAHTQKSALVCRDQEDGGSAPTATPCSEFVTQAPVGLGRDVYLVMAGVDENGVKGLSCGIAYDGAGGSGTDVVSWTFCGDGLEFPSDTWPADGSGNRMTWLSCQSLEIPPDGVHAVAGAFYLYAYGSDSFQVTENKTLLTPPELLYTDCHGASIGIPVTATASVRFSPDGAEPGYNPCTGGVPVYQGLELDKGTEDLRTGYVVAEGQGGPDRFGYRWIDSDAEFGPIFNWVDVSDVGTPVPITGDDQTSAPLPIGFPFPFYGETFEEFRVCTNGWLSFTSSSTQYTNQPLPSSLAPENLLAVLWDDLELEGQPVFYYDDGSRLIVQFQEAWENGLHTFEVVLYPDGTILYQYLTNPEEYGGATVGIQNGTRDDGLTVAFNTPYVHDRLAVRLAAPADWLTVVPATGTVPAGECLGLALTMDATWLTAGDYRTQVALGSNDPVNAQITRDVLFHVGSIEVADVDVDPNTLNLGSNGRWLTARVELPVEYAPEDVVAGTVRLNGLVSAEPDMTTVGDFNENGIPDLSFKFDRVDAESRLAEGDSVEVGVTGEVRDTIWFTGTDHVRIIRPSLESPNGGESLPAGTLTRIEWKNPRGWSVTGAAITYSADGGQTWSLVSQDAPPDGYTWRVPEEVTENALVSIYVYDDQGMLGHDTSDGAFSVVNAVTGVEETLPTAYALLQNAPNPFSGTSRIRFDLPEAARVDLRIYDVAGRVVRTLEDRWIPAGRHEAVWDGKDEGGRPVAGGVYFYRLRAGSFSARRTLSLLR